jgi:hypothetical protein
VISEGLGFVSAAEVIGVVIYVFSRHLSLLGYPDRSGVVSLVNSKLRNLGSEEKILSCCSLHSLALVSHPDPERTCAISPIRALEEQARARRPSSVCKDIFCSKENV